MKMLARWIAWDHISGKFELNLLRSLGIVKRILRQSIRVIEKDRQIHIVRNILRVDRYGETQTDRECNERQTER